VRERSTNWNIRIRKVGPLETVGEACTGAALTPQTQVIAAHANQWQTRGTLLLERHADPTR